MLLFLSFSLGFILSCSTVAPASYPVHQQQPVQQVSKIPSEIGWSPRVTATSRQYLIQDSTAISTTADTVQTRVTQTRTTYSIHISALGDSLRFAAKQDSVITTSQFPLSRVTSNVRATGIFHGILSVTGQISSLTEDSIPSCSEGIAPAGVRVYDLIIGYPTKMLGVGDEWSDTVSTTVCRGKTLLTQQAIRTYRILGFTTWRQHPAVAIKRGVTSILSTNSKQTQIELGVNGSGTNSGVIYTDRATGILFQNDTELQSTLTISTTRGVFQFNEVAKTHTELQ
jgi:hypothetical protein